MTSETNKPFNRFWEEDVTPYIEACGYSFKGASAIYAVASTGIDRYMDFPSEVTGTLNSGFSLEEGIRLITASINENIAEPIKHIHAGYCLDTALGKKIKLSLWLFIKRPNQPLQ